MKMNIQTLINKLEEIKKLYGENVECIVNGRVGVNIIEHLDRPREVFVNLK